MFEAIERGRSRTEAKRTLGLPQNSVILLTIARAVKFRPIGGLSFADMLLPVMRANPHVRLIAVGPSGSVDWSAAEALVPGRIQVHAERSDTQGFFEAADIYIDLFPFPSITSLFEAGLHGLPLVTLYPYGPGCEVMGADFVGLDAVLIRAHSVAELRDDVRHLIESAELRARIGERTRSEILATNTGENWSRAIHAVYDHAFRLPPREDKPAADQRAATR